VIKSKAKIRPDLERLLAKAKKRLARMTPAEKREMFKRQCKSWARQDKD
jgi:hypothetical protein